MDWVNYHHLLYFYTVAKEGGLVPAGKVLRLSHATLSAQIRTLESQLGEKLLTKVGRKLELTETGRVVYRYADEIFSLGSEMVDAVKGRSSGAGKALRFDVGVADVVPKLIVRRLLQPALELPGPVHLACFEDTFDKLLASLALHSLDIVIADAPVPPGSAVRAFNHFLGETGVTIFGSSKLAASLRRGFPESLDGAPFLLPLEQLTLRRSLNQWFSKYRVTPRVVAEFEDSALLKAFGADGLGLFAGPTAVEAEIRAQYQVAVVGRTTEVKERFYAISVERRLKHPAVLAISATARDDIFATQ
jgi:LysR family transcriptional activator of nhaA